MVELRYVGHLGNNLFQYAIARALAEDLGHALTCRVEPSTATWKRVEDASGVVDKLVGCWGAFDDAPQSLPGRTIEAPSMRWVFGEKLGWSGHGANLDLARARGRDHRIVLQGWFQRAELIRPHEPRVRRWLRLRPRALPVDPGPRDAVVHVRRSLDVRVLDRTLDVSYSANALEALAPERVFVIGTGLDASIRAALARFRPVWLPDLDALDSLALLTRARRIVMANSTFSWWGAYLSDADRVVFPLPERGLWSADRADVDLRVPEARYTYVHDVPLEPFRPFRRTRERLPTKLEEETARVVEWMDTQRAPFGPIDLQQAGLGGLRNLRGILAAALRANLVEEITHVPGEPPLADLLGAAFGTS